MSVCDRDCLHCPYPDCVCDEMDYADYQAADRIDREIIHPRTARQERIAAQQRAYREANRERYNAYQRKYYHRKREEATRNVTPNP